MAEIRTKDVDINYDSINIVKQLNITIPKQQITAIIGPNGCGKSTILKTLARIHPAKSGEILLDGKEIHSISSIEIARKMAILPQSPVAPEGLMVHELVAYGRYPHQKGFGRLNDLDRDKITWALNITGLSKLADRRLDTLSGGQRQKVWIAMALVQDTELILLDEPTTYLDLVHQLDVLLLLQKLNRQEGKTIALVIHELNMAARFADFMIAVKQGTIIASGTAEEIMTPDILREVFDIEAVIQKEPVNGKMVCLTYDHIS